MIVTHRVKQDSVGDLVHARIQNYTGKGSKFPLMRAGAFDHHSMLSSNHGKLISDTPVLWTNCRTFWNPKLNNDGINTTIPITKKQTTLKRTKIYSVHLQGILDHVQIGDIVTSQCPCPMSIPNMRGVRVPITTKASLNLGFRSWVSGWCCDTGWRTVAT